MISTTLRDDVVIARLDLKNLCQKTKIEEITA